MKMLNLKLKDVSSTRSEIYLMGFSINKFAKKIGVSPSQLSKVLSGEANPYPPFAKKIANGLGVEISDIFFAQSDSKKI